MEIEKIFYVKENILGKNMVCAVHNIIIHTCRRYSSLGLSQLLKFGTWVRFRVKPATRTQVWHLGSTKLWYRSLNK